MASLQLNELALPYIRAGILATRGQPTAQTGLKIAEAAALADTDQLIKALLAHSEQLSKSAEQAHRARAEAEDRVTAMEKCLADTREQIESAMQRIKSLQADMACDAAVIRDMGEEMKRLLAENQRLREASSSSDADEPRPIWGACTWDCHSDSE